MNDIEFEKLFLKHSILLIIIFRKIREKEIEYEYYY